MAQARQLRLVVTTGSGRAQKFTVWRGAEESLKLFAGYLRDEVDIELAALR